MQNSIRGTWVQHFCPVAAYMALPEATPSQRHLTLGVSFHRLSTKGGTRSSTLGPTPLGMGAVGVEDTLLLKHPSGEASPCYSSRARLRCDTDRHPRRTATCREQRTRQTSIATAPDSSGDLPICNLCF